MARSSDLLFNRAKSSSFINLFGVPKKIKSDRGSAFKSEVNEEFFKNRIIEKEYSPSLLFTGTGTVERAIQTLKNLLIANLENKIGFTESINLALRVMRFTIHTGHLKYIMAENRELN